MISIGVKELLDAGVHFGHQTKRWNPKMKPFIFDTRTELVSGVIEDSLFGCISSLGEQDLLAEQRFVLHNQNSHRVPIGSTAGSDSKPTGSQMTRK